MYLNDPRENSIDLPNHVIWEEDNRVEPRWQWNAQILDLCGMDPNDLQKTIFNVQEAESEKIKNHMTLHVNGNSATVEFPYSPASDVVMVVEDSDGNRDVITIPAGSSSPYNISFDTVSPQKISKVLIGATEESATSMKFSDEEYEYTISKTSSSTEDVRYGFLKHTVVEEGLTQDIVESSFFPATLTSFIYTIAPVAIECFNELSEEEFRNVLKQEQLDLLVYSTREVRKIYLNGTDDQTTSWELNYRTISVNNTQYYVSRYVDDEMVNVYDPEDQDPTTISLAYEVEF